MYECLTMNGGFFLKTFCYPLCVFGITLASRQLFDEI
jgi:hypothetical protein